MWHQISIKWELQGSWLSQKYLRITTFQKSFHNFKMKNCVFYFLENLNFYQIWLLVKIIFSYFCLYFFSFQTLNPAPTKQRNICLNLQEAWKLLFCNNAGKKKLSKWKRWTLKTMTLSSWQSVMMLCFEFDMYLIFSGTRSLC